MNLQILLFTLLLLVFVIPGKVFSNSGGLEITFDDGTKQQIRLNQPKEHVHLLEFTRNNGGETVDMTKDYGFGTKEWIDVAFEGSLYFIPEGTNRLPNLDRLSPVGKIYTPKIDISPRRFDQGFPGIPNRVEWFAVRYTASFNVSQSGKYSFRTISDDGVILTIDGRKVIDDADGHPPRSASGEIQLSRGTHQIRLDYFQGPRYDLAIQLFVTNPGGSERIFDLREF